MIRDIASGPMMRNQGELPHQIVLRVELAQGNMVMKFIVHLAVYSENGKMTYSQGDYFTIDPSKEYTTEVLKNFDDALDKFSKRVKHICSGRFPYVDSSTEV